MIGKVKQWLGIEGVKVELILPDIVNASSGVINGQLKFQTMHTQRVKKVRITLTEKYSRGRFKNRVTDQYKIAENEQRNEILILANEPVEVSFTLPFTLVKSDMDEIGDKNIVFQKIVGAAKALKNVRSEYTIEVEATVEGTALNPFDKKIINIQ